VRLLRVAIAAAGSGSWSPWTWSLQWTGDWTLLAAAAPLVEWTPGYSALHSPRRHRKSKAHPPCPSAIASSLSLASPKSTDSLREVRASAPDSVPPRRSTRRRCVLSRQFPVKMRFCGENLWFRAEISRLAADLALFSWVLQVGGFTGWKFSTAAGTFVPSWFIFVWIGLVRMGGGGAGIRSVWVRGR